MMTKTQLKSLTKEALVAEAKKLGLKPPVGLRKDQLVEKITDALNKTSHPASESRSSAMDKKDQSKRPNLLKSVLGAASAKKSAAADTSYARKPASNIQRRKTTLRKIEKVVTASREKREKKITAEQEIPAKPHETPATAPEPVAIPPQASADLVAHKFDIEPHRQPASTSHFENLGELPEAYESCHLFLAARDPHWLFAYWDVSWNHMQHLRNQASDHTVRLRVYSEENHQSHLQQDLILHPDAKNWFVHVGQSRKFFRAELGYYSNGGFHVISRSRTVKTPADDLSSNTHARFATLPFHIKFHELVEYVKTHFHAGDELMDVLYRLQARGFKLPFEYDREGDWGEDQEAILLQLFGEDLYRRIQMGSFEISEWLRRKFREESLGGLSSWSSPSSPFGASWQKQYRGFWLNVNAEIILYGETDPKAKVCVDGKEIKLRPDGSFRFHFALPDGKFHLPITAEAPDGLEKRSAVIEFTRATGIQGQVGKSKAKEQLPDPIRA